MLQEIGIHSLANNVTIIPNRKKGDSGEWSILAGKISRNIPQEGNFIQKTPDWENPNSRLTNIREKSALELLTSLSIKDRRRLAKAPPS